MQPSSRFRFLFILILAVAPVVARADSDSLILVVPASKATLQIAVDLPKTIHSNTGWQLVEVDKPNSRLAVQTVAKIAADGTEQRGRGRIVADIPSPGGDARTRRFRLEPSATGPGSPAFAFSADSPASLRLSEQKHAVLVYNHGVITDEQVPPNDSRRSRACYIHPLWGLSGEVLTDDFPKDHYHHHGVFWAWPHVEVGNEKHDLWMHRDIAQKSVRWLGQDTGALAAVLGLENGWFVGDRKVMIERVWIQAARATPTARALDLDFTWIPIGRPITLRGAEGKSYGGLNVRFAVASEKDSVITVPAGASPNDLPDTPLPWADLTCKFAGATQPSGAAIFVPRDHPNYPPTWLTRHYGALCIGWPGVKGKTFEPGKPIHLHYRLWIHPTAVDVAALKAAYKAYLAANESHWE
ncbi:MAG: DUF6807 family protein [Thermoguttaceae bacterium]